MIRLAALLVTVSALACNGTSAPVCTLEARAGINLTVVDDAGQPVTNAIAQAREGSYVETLQSTGPGILFGVFEREGDYDVTVTAPGFKEWNRDIEVDADECHVIPVRLTVELERE
jgi:hypothetical protein